MKNSFKIACLALTIAVSAAACDSTSTKTVKDSPKVDSPKVDSPKVDSPKVDSPKAK
ncbi:hypothetical protein [Mucilaginibacter psychrotolerans]|uniref:hypothetical protein n=1 Tax=Mucilaginibacter psychrotolerans TaxID=1524096 RepID=UPI001F0001EB|nr:hypothetical protein [Mucilaginibacter psychrotolerans]